MKEYAVLVKTRKGVRFAGPGFGASWTTDLERVREHYEWLTGRRREEMQRRADENQASGFAGGNEAWGVWNNEHEGQKFDRYAVVEREVQPWSVVQSEDGFNA